VKCLPTKLYGFDNVSALNTLHLTVLC